MLSVILPTLRRFFKRSIATYAAVSLADCTQTPMSIVLSRCQQTRIARFSYLTQTDCKSPISLQLSKWTLGLHLQTTSLLTTETLGASQMSVGCSCLKPVQALQTPSTDAHTSVCKAALCNLASKDIQGLQIAFSAELQHDLCSSSKLHDQQSCCHGLQGGRTDPGQCQCCLAVSRCPRHGTGVKLDC